MGGLLAFGNHAKYGKRSTRNKTKNVVIRMAYFVVLFALAAMYSFASGSSSSTAEKSPFRQLASVNISAINITDPCDVIFTEFDKSDKEIAIILYIVGILYVFLGVAVVCDDHFCVGLEVICDVLELDEAVAGATFMAAGSSAPELATSLVTVFTTKDGTGLGTILGSAVFNLVMIVCLSGMFGNGPEYKLRFDKEGKNFFSSDACKAVVGTFTQDNENPGKFKNPGLFLDWRPLLRDAIFYIVSLVICVFFALTDVGGHWCEDAIPGTTFVARSAGGTGAFAANKKTCDQYNYQPGYRWWEGLVLTLCYGVYIQSMIKNDELMDWLAGPKNAEGVPSRMTNHVWGFVCAKEVMNEREEAIAHELEFLDQSESQKSIKDADDEETALIAKVELRFANREMSHPVLESFKKRVDQLEKRVYHSRQMVALFETISDTKYMYKLAHDQPNGLHGPDDDDDDANILDKFLGFCAVPWDIAFKYTIPPCDRDSYQVWPSDESAFVNFEDMPAESKKLILRERDAKGLNDEADKLQPEHVFVKGKYTRKKVLIWYNRSKVYLVSFFMSIVWIAVTSWLMVTFASSLGCHFGVGPFLMGLVVLAAGTSIPDALSSVVVAQEGDGDMAVANAIGSNVFNIFLGIGLPMMFSEWVADSEGNYQPYLVSDTLAVITTSVMLIVITMIMLLAIWGGKWILTPKLSTILMVMFFVYIGVGVIFDTGAISLYKELCDATAPALMTTASMFSCETNCPGLMAGTPTCNWI